MAIYKLKQKVYEMYEIEADSADEALDILYSGDVDPRDYIYEEIIFDNLEI